MVNCYKKEFEELQEKNEKLRDEINNICDDLKLEETRQDLWLLINELIENELNQEKLCNE